VIQISKAFDGDFKFIATMGEVTKNQDFLGKKMPSNLILKFISIIEPP